MRERVRAFLVALRRRFLAPVTVRLDTVDARLDGIDRRLDRIEIRLADIVMTVEAAGARASTATEGGVALSESQVRIERRIGEIERLLGAPAGNR